MEGKCHVSIIVYQLTYLRHTVEGYDDQKAKEAYNIYSKASVCCAEMPYEYVDGKLLKTFKIAYMLSKDAVMLKVINTIIAIYEGI